VFVEVLMVTMVLHRLLENREKRLKIRKLSVIVGAFFNKFGTKLLQELLIFDSEKDKTMLNLHVSSDWHEEKFFEIRNQVEESTFLIDPLRGNLTILQKYLTQNRDIITRILENPHIMEHEYFTDMLWAVCHVCDELEYRKHLGELSSEDINHLAIDINRAYSRLIAEWLTYMKNLQKEYPFLFSLACRINPFDPNAKVEL
jgi:hypothetical protein